MMMIGTLALTGVGIPRVIGFAGYFSKDAIIESGLCGGDNASPASPSCCSSSPRCFTSFYSWRLIFMTFHGKPRAPTDGDATTCTRARR